ncbi:MAG TPA: mechanosensitive ion channel family protein [Acidobacteriota bacterium]|nr:mechanosensitive ion channel family protein [Acidobacteriota bacterium]
MLDLFGTDFMFQILQAAIIVAGAFVSVKIFNRLLLRMAGGRTQDKKRIMQNAQRFLQIVIYSIAAVLLLWTFKVDVTALLAGLGVGALVIGFALKDFIENWVSGLLIISGKTYKIGDIIQVGNMKGVVTEISLRTTKLKTYDRNEIIIPNSSLLKDKIVNLTGGGKETVASIVFSIDYTFDAEKAKKSIESVLRNHPRVVVDEKRRREIRFLVRSKEWATEIESLFWINDPENEEFIKSQITESVKTRFEEARILPPIPSIMRKDFLESKK